MDEENDRPLDPQERDMLEQDLVDVESLKSLLEAKGIKGVVFYCPDCDEDHYLAWDLLHSNLKELLDEGESPVHEPAFDPDPDEYVSWDYARGYLDGYESFEQEEMSETVLRLVAAMKGRGWSEDEIRSFLASAQLTAPAPVDEG